MLSNQSSDKKTIQFTVSIEEYEEIKAYADATERTPSNLAKYAVKQHMKRYKIEGVNKREKA